MSAGLCYISILAMMIHLSEVKGATELTTTDYQAENTNTMQTSYEGEPTINDTFSSSQQIEPTNTSKKLQNSTKSPDFHNVLLKLSLVSVLIAPELQMNNFFVSLCALFFGVILWCAQYILIRRCYHKPGIHYWCDEQKSRKDIMYLTVAEEFPDYENI